MIICIINIDIPCSALQTTIEGGLFGTMLLHHPIIGNQEQLYEQRDKSFRDACCGFNNDIFCNKFIQRRPINNCAGYQPPDIGMIDTQTV